MPQLKDRHFQTVADLIQDEIGIQISENKRTMVEGRLRKRMRALDLDSLEAYGTHLFEDGHLAEEFVHIIDCITTNKTDFFREPAHFEHLRDDLVPLLCRRRGGSPHLKIWSSAASTGAEAYTLAMVLQDMIAAGRGFNYTILGTDISTEVLRIAEDAIYPEETLAQVPPAFRRRYVMNSRDPQLKLGRIVPELRSHVHFQRLNLMDPYYAVDQDVDVIFCRNVLIYFDKDTQKEVLGRLALHLRPGGFLIVGHSESMAGTGVPGLQQVSATIFRRTQDAVR